MLRCVSVNLLVHLKSAESSLILLLLFFFLSLLLSLVPSFSSSRSCWFILQGGRRTMSKISLTIVLPHHKTNGSRMPSFYFGTSNNTYLGCKGTDFKSARFENNNIKREWRNRFEYGCVAGKGVTKLSLYTDNLRQSSKADNE